MLSTLNPILGISKDFKAKPDLSKLHDFTNGGTDIVDQKISYFCKPKSSRWPIKAFSSFLDICLVNVSTMLALNPGYDPQKQDSYVYGFDLAMDNVCHSLEISNGAG